MYAALRPTRHPPMRSKSSSNGLLALMTREAPSPSRSLLLSKKNGVRPSPLRLRPESAGRRYRAFVAENSTDFPSTGSSGCWELSILTPKFTSRWRSSQKTRNDQRRRRLNIALLSNMSWNRLCRGLHMPACPLSVSWPPAGSRRTISFRPSCNGAATSAGCGSSGLPLKHRATPITSARRTRLTRPPNSVPPF